MSSRLVLLFIFIAALAGQLIAQQPAADPAKAAAIEAPQVPPSVPATAAPAAAPVAPPLPGQLTAAPAAPASRIPDVPAPQATNVPVTPLSTTKGVPSTSSSGQFIVHGNDMPLRSAFSTRCEEIHDELRQLLHDQQPWVLPIVVLLNSGETARKADKTVILTLSEITSGGFHIQVTVNLRPDLRPSEFRAELVRALLMERVLRHQKDSASKRASLLPDWVYTGAMEALDYRKQARPSTLFAAIFKSGKIFGIEEIIEASPTQMDALSKTIYNTSCCALVLALLDQPEGGARINRFLASLASDARPERELLDQAFPSFTTSPTSLNKWWALQLASLSRPGLSEPLSPDSTFSALEDALTLRYQARPSEIPQPRPVVAKITPTEPARISKPSESSPVVVSEITPLAEKKRSIFRWLNPFGRKSSEEAAIDAAIEQAAEEEAKTRVAEETKAADKPVEVATIIELPTADGPRAEPSEERKTIFNKWFGNGRKKSSDDTAPAAEEAAEEEKKPSRLNPLNWFRSGKGKDKEAAEPEAPEKPAEKSTASLHQDWFTVEGRPLVAFVYQETAVEDAPKKKRMFGIFGGGKKPEEPKKEEPEPQKEDKPAPKKESKEKPKAPEPKPSPAEEKKPEPKKVEEAKPAAAMPAETTEAPADPAKPRRGGLRGLFGGGEKKPTEQPKPTEPPAEATKPEPMAAEAKPAPEKPAEKPKATAEAPAKTEAPKPAEMPAEPVAEADKPKREPMKIRPLFGGGKKPEDGLMPGETPDAAPKAQPMIAEPTPEEAKPVPKPKAVAEETPKPAKPKTEPEPEMPVVKKAPEPKPAKKPEETEPTVAATVPIEDFAAIMKRPDRKEILQRNLAALTALQQRSAILFRPIVVEYTALVSELSEGKNKNVEERLAKLRERSQRALDQSKAIRDQLDLHEANSSPAMSGAFEDYLRLPETIQKELPARQDAISKYLDSLDREFAKP
jgi:hypothetical protein